MMHGYLIRHSRNVSAAMFLIRWILKLVDWVNQITLCNVDEFMQLAKRLNRKAGLHSATGSSASSLTPGTAVASLPRVSILQAHSPDFGVTRAYGLDAFLKVSLCQDWISTNKRVLLRVCISTLQKVRNSEGCFRCWDLTFLQPNTNISLYSWSHGMHDIQGILYFISYPNRTSLSFSPCYIDFK